MGATLESLRNLQDIELQIVDIRRQLESKERAVKRQADKLKTAQEELEDHREDLKRTQVQMDDVDVTLRGRNEHVGKLRDTLNTVKTNKEYAAVLSQLNNEKADVSRLETRAYELLSVVEEKKRLLVEKQTAVKHEADRLENLQAQFQQGRASFADRLEVLERQRDAAADALDPKSLDLFNRVSERYEGEVMARVIQTHPRRQEYLCDGCNMSLAAERANALLTRDEVITCDNCGRILFIEKN